IGLATLPPHGGGPIFCFLGRNERGDEIERIDNGVEAWIAPQTQPLAGRPVSAAFGGGHGVGVVGGGTPIRRRHHSKDGCCFEQYGAKYGDDERPCDQSAWSMPISSKSAVNSM